MRLMNIQWAQIIFVMGGYAQQSVMVQAQDENGALPYEWF